jgi:hypothetical protein
VIEKILFVSDGIIVLVSSELEITDFQPDNVVLEVADFGANFSIFGMQLSLPASALEHLVQADRTAVFFYKTEPYTLIATFLTNVVLERDEVVKVKGAWDYVSSSTTYVGNTSDSV